MVENINNIKLEIISLYRTDYQNKFHVREIAKLIEKSHVGLLPYLKEFEKNKVLLVKQVGRSKLYSLNFDNNLVREFLSLSEKKKTLQFLNKEYFIKKIYDELINLNLQGSLIIFGSYASGSHTKESDIDLLYMGDIKEFKKKKIDELGKIYRKKIHLISMTTKQFKEQLLKNSSLIKEIIKNHIILYNHDIFINEIWRNYYEKR